MDSVAFYCGLTMGIYETLGLPAVINASGAVTRLGGAPMPRSVLQAFYEAARETVPLEQLQAVASLKIAAATHTEAGLVTAGSAAALTLVTAAILTGYDLGRMERLPHCDSFPHEFVIARAQRSGYDHAVRLAGAQLVEVGFNEIVANAGVRRTEAWEYEAAFGPNTAGVVYVYSPQSQPPLAEVVERAHRHKLPVLVDAAGELPPRANLVQIAATGADLVAFSGGKAIRGPQSTGILCGRRDLIGPAAVQMLDMDDHFALWSPPANFIDKDRLGGIPRHGIGRAMKVSKEEIVALLTALELFNSGLFDADLAPARAHLDTIAAGLEGLPVKCRIEERPGGECQPLLVITLDESALPRSAVEVCRSLRQGQPPIYVGHGRLSQGQLVINPLCLTDAQSQTIARRLREELTVAIG